jgi:hypothetical protein
MLLQENLNLSFKGIPLLPGVCNLLLKSLAKIIVVDPSPDIMSEVLLVHFVLEERFYDGRGTAGITGRVG